MNRNGEGDHRGPLPPYLDDRPLRDALRPAFRAAGRPAFLRAAPPRFAAATLRGATFDDARATRPPRGRFADALRAALRGAAARTFAAGRFAAPRFATFFAERRGAATEAFAFFAARFLAGAFAAARTDLLLADFSLFLGMRMSITCRACHQIPDRNSLSTPATSRNARDARAARLLHLVCMQ